MLGAWSRALVRGEEEEEEEEVKQCISPPSTLWIFVRSPNSKIN
jgi:hypothetical protein